MDEMHTISLVNSLEAISESLKEISTELTELRRDHHDFVHEYIYCLRGVNTQRPHVSTRRLY